MSRARQWRQAALRLDYPTGFGEPIITHGSVVALDIGILLRVSGLNVDNRNASLGGPFEHRFTDVLGTVTASLTSRLAAPFSDLV